MLDVSIEILREMKQKSRTFRAKIYRKSTGELLTDNVRVMNCNGASSDGADVTIGQAFPRALTFSCPDIGLKEGDGIKVVITLKVRSNFVGGDMPFGEFTITNAVKGLDGIDYTAYDKLYINSTKDVTSLPTSFDSACTAIGNLIGAPFSKADSDVYPYGSNSQSHLSAIQVPENIEFKALEAAGYLAGLVGCNAFINRNGNLVFKAQQDVEIGYPLDDRIEDKTIEFQVTIGSIEVRGARGAEDIYTLNRSNSRGAKLYTENPMAMSAADVAWRIDNRMTHGADVVNKGTLVMKLGDPRIDPWDIINNYACSTLNMEFDGGITTTIESIAKTDQERQIEEKDRFKQVKAELDAIQAAVDDVSGDLDDISGSIDDISGSIDDLDEELGYLGEDLSDLSGDVEDMGNDIDAIEDSVEDIYGEIENLTANYDSFLEDYERFKEQASAGLNSTTGYYKTTQTVNGATISYMHDKPKLSDSTYIWKFTIDSIAVSIDGGKTYPFGMTVDGQLVQKYITAEVVNALELNAGAIKSGTMSCDRLSGGVITGQKFVSAKSDTNGNTNLTIFNGMIIDYGMKFGSGSNLYYCKSQERGGAQYFFSDKTLSNVSGSDAASWDNPSCQYWLRITGKAIEMFTFDGGTLILSAVAGTGVQGTARNLSFPNANCTVDSLSARLIGGEEVAYLLGNKLKKLPTANINELLEPGVYSCPKTVTGYPSDASYGGRLEVILLGTNIYKQILHIQNANCIRYERYLNFSGNNELQWKDWRTFTSTATVTAKT